MRRSALAAGLAVIAAALAVVLIRVQRPDRLPTLGPRPTIAVFWIAGAVLVAALLLVLAVTGARSGGRTARWALPALVLVAVGLAGASRPAWWPSLPEIAGDVSRATGCVPGPEFEVVITHGRPQGGRGLLCSTRTEVYLVALFTSDDRRDGLLSDHVSGYPLCRALRDTTPLPRHHWLVSSDCGHAGVEKVQGAIGGEFFSMPG